MSAPTPAQKKPETLQLERIDDYLSAKQPWEAKALALSFAEKNPANADGWILLGRAHLDLLQFASALEAAQKAVALAPQHPIARTVLMDALLRCGQIEKALNEASSLEAERKFDPVILLKVGQFYSQTNRHEDAARVFQRVCVLRPADPGVHYHLASAYVALGNMEKVEAIFDDVLRKRPHEFEAYYNRTNLRKQTPERNHVAEMERVLNDMLVSDSGGPLLCYSLAKELEDLGEWKRSFTYLRRGADMRKRQSGYRVEPDLEFLERYQKQFDESFFAQARPGYEAESPFFVLGMPRSGTTLVDRIISSHSKVGSVGESREFTNTVVRQTDEGGEVTVIALVRAKEFDYEKIGREYCDSINGWLPGYAHLLDKTPSNFSFIGTILTALPNAKIIHLRRHPVDSCYAMYKTLFRSGFDFSYDLKDVGRFYLGYLKLMEHWRRVLPGRFHDVYYEDIVNNQEEESRKMIAFCGLDWEDACLSFEKNSSPSLTASAAQVRQPIYKSSVALWRRYEEELAPLIRTLRDGGIEID
ncbi:MAG TPA: sulfotransferase [Rhizomicrobium sp.]|nr:sulfotransferase [Rhizomicrobium sp.]